MNFINDNKDSSNVQTITIYFCTKEEVEKFIEKVKSVYCKNNVQSRDKLNEIAGEINKIIVAHSQQDSDERIEFVGQGASSICYKSEEKIYKAFLPQDLFRDGVCKTDDLGKFLWLDDRATNGQAYRFLKRYVRFILQNDVIDLLDTKNDNEFIKPELKLTSRGFVWVVENFNGCTLEEDFEKDHIKPTNDPIKDTLNEILYRIEKVKQAAINVQVYCHNKNIFHSDIKPSNFYVIKSEIKTDNGNEIKTHEDIVRNIDFDSWITEQRFNDGFLDLLSTTPLFYFDCHEIINTNQSIEKWQIYDIRALSRMLMYALLDNSARAAIVEREFIREPDFDWVDFFFEGINGKEVFAKFAALGLPGLYVFDKLKRLLFDCSPYALPQNVIRSIKSFIGELENIENLIKSLISVSGNPPAVLNESAIRYSGLKRLDAERGDKPLKGTEYDKLIDQGLSCDWVRYVIEQNYYSQDEKDYDAIDRHLLPDIQCGKGDDERVEYDFERGMSPLEQVLQEKVKDKSLFLTAEGGQGKTTTLRSFWLDFLSGKHNIPCLYIDCKLLAQNSSSAIKEYISNTYRTEVSQLTQFAKQLDKKPILLLDGANESNEDFRRVDDSEEDCKLVKACKDLIGDFKLVIGSRSDIIHIAKVQSKEDAILNKKEDAHEFEEQEMQYGKVLPLRDDQIELCLGDIYSDIENKKPMIDLLRNNMMLHIFMHLKNVYKIDIPPEKMKAGKLLDYYFQICFKTRYVRSQLDPKSSEYHLSDKDLFKEIEQSSKDNDSENADNIKIITKRYERIVKFLTLNCTKKYINSLPVGEGIYPSTFENLSILVKDPIGYYVWANEIYQEYFQALYLKECLEKIQAGQSVGQVDISAYNAFQFCGEIAPYNDENYEHFVDILSKVADPAEFSTAVILELWGVHYEGHVHSGRDTILRIAVCSGHNFPGNLKHIGDNVFFGCRSLTSIEIPDGVTSIGNGAFGGCDSLTSIKIPDSVTDIGDFAFFDTAYYNNKSNWRSGVLYIDNHLISAKYAISEACRIKQGTLTIADSAFLCPNLTSVNIPNSVKKIGNHAFSRCHSLKRIELPDGVTNIGKRAFSDCSSLMHIEISSSVTSIGDYAFYGCDSLTSILYTGEIKDWCIISGLESLMNVRSKHKKLTINGKVIAGNLVIPDGVTRIENSAFRDCRSLTSIKIPSSVACIEKWAFSGCINLTSVEIPSGVTSIGEGVFWYCSSLKHIQIPSSVTSIGYYAFRGCSSLTSIEIPNGVTSIRDYAFYHCNSLTSIQIPNSVTSIADSVFRGCWNLTNIEIPNGVTSIGNYAFYHCSSLTSIQIPNSVTSIGDDAFRGCSGLMSIEIPNGITSIGNYAFHYCSSLTNITIPNGVTSIGDYTFTGCSGLMSIEIPSSVASIGDYAFYHCSGLTSIEIPNSIESIGRHAFADCRLEKIIVTKHGYELLLEAHDQDFFKDAEIIFK